MMTIGMVVDIDQFPTMLAFLSHPLTEEHAPSLPMEGGDDKEEADE